jgi:hypothetical protein
VVIIYLGRRLPAASTSDLTRSSGTSNPRRLEDALPPYTVLLQVGFTRPVSHLTAGELLPHHFNLTGKPAVCFCGTFLGVTPTGCYPAPCSTELGLSSYGPAARDHPACLDTAV